jgi:hypothetical protein
MSYKINRFFGALSLLIAAGGCTGAAGQRPQVTEVSPSLLVFATDSGNVVASVGPEGAVLVGTPSVDSTPEIERVLASRTKSPTRYVVIAPEDLEHTDGDAGWGQRGAFVAMQEKMLELLGGHAMGPPRPLPERLSKLGVDRPRVAFSEVLTFDLNGEAIHVVHQPAGCSNADAIAHFHVAKVVYLGEVFPGDGYPRIDPDRGGKLEGVINTLSHWAGGPINVVPVRGKVMSGEDVKEFRDMIIAVRNQVQGMSNAGRTENEVQAAHPSAEFDAKWGHGRVSPGEFVSEIYEAVKAH